MNRSERRKKAAQQRRRAPENEVTAKNHLAGRQNAIKEVPEAELNGYLNALAEAFGLDWLEAGGSTPLQQLWARRDFLATNQLLLFGDAVQHLGSVVRRDLADRRRSPAP